MSQSRSFRAFQFQHDSFQQFEIVDVLDRHEPVLPENGNERLGPQFVEGGFQTSPATFAQPACAPIPVAGARRPGLGEGSTRPKDLTGLPMLFSVDLRKYCQGKSQPLMVFSRLQLGDMLLRPLRKLDKFLVVENVDKVCRRNSALGQIPASVR